MENLEKQIQIVKEDILKRFPDCNYTIKILLWDDNTNLVECRHGRDNKICISTLYDNTLIYEEFEIKSNSGMFVDEYGTEYYPRN